jgi:predicted dehydrogenase
MSAAPIRIGVIGAGWAANVQVPVLQALPDFEVVALTSARRARAEAAAARLGLSHAFTDFREVLALPGLDAVYIGAPPALHHEMTLAAVRAGKHVLCEKPVALNRGQAREMGEAAHAAGVTAMVNFQWRWSPARRQIARLIREGYAGEIREIHLQQTSEILLDPVRRSWSWSSQRSQGGGFLASTGSHLIDALRVWNGEITAVQAHLRTSVAERKLPDRDEHRAVDADDAFVVLCRFAGGAVATLIGSGVVPGPRRLLAQIFGARATLVLADEQTLTAARPGQGRPELLDRPADLVRETAAVPIPEAPARAGAGRGTDLRWSAQLAREFARGIREGRSPAPSLDDGLRCQAIMDAIYASNASGRWEDVAP